MQNHKKRLSQIDAVSPGDALHQKMQQESRAAELKQLLESQKLDDDSDYYNGDDDDADYDGTIRNQHS